MARAGARPGAWPGPVFRGSGQGQGQGQRHQGTSLGKQGRPFQQGPLSLGLHAVSHPTPRPREDKGCLIFLLSPASAAELAPLRFPPSPVPVPAAGSPRNPCSQPCRRVKDGHGQAEVSNPVHRNTSPLYSTEHLFYSIYSSSWGSGTWGAGRGPVWGSPCKAKVSSGRCHQGTGLPGLEGTPRSH